MLFNKESLMRPLQLTCNELSEFPWESAVHYAIWSAQTFYIVRQSTRLFAIAACRTPLADNAVHDRLLSHMREEKGHEHLSNRDLKVLGMNLKEIPELSTTKCVYQTQYYWTEHVSPYAFFGYLLALESLAIHAGPQAHQRVCAAHGTKASSFLKVHTEEDISHVEDVIDWIAKMPKAEQELIYENYVHTLENYKNMVIEIRTQALIQQLRSA